MQYVFAQEGGGGGGGGRGNFDPEAMKTRAMDSVKEALALTDEEWKAIQPKVEKVYAQMREPGVAGAMRMSRRRSESAPAPESAVGKAAKELETVLGDKESKPEAVKATLDAFRAARDKARQELAAARQELKASVSARQEAQLVLSGYLE
jgi:membrane carboxypeptidase/penicillin-binding protein PbpC